MTRRACFTHGPADMQPVPASVRNWLIVVAAMIFFMIVIGALTRLTEFGAVDGEWRPVTGWSAAAVGRRLAGGAAEISFLAAGKIDQSWFHDRRVQGNLLAGVHPSPVGPADRRGLRPASGLVLDPRQTSAGTEATPGSAAGPGRPAGRFGLGDGGFRPGRPALGQPLPAWPAICCWRWRSTPTRCG